MPATQSNLTNMNNPNPNTNTNTTRDENRRLNNTNAPNANNKTNVGGRMDNDNANMRVGQGNMDESNYSKNTQRELSGGVERANAGMRDEIQGTVGGNGGR